jgi:hypothetical protein
MPVMDSPLRLILSESTPYLAHLLGAADDRPERELVLRQVRRGGVAEAARHGDLLAGGQVARADDRAVVDRVADHHVEARLGGGSAHAARPAHVQILPRDLGAPQDVLLGRHPLDRVEARLVVPGEVRVRLDHARHQERARAVDHLRAEHRVRRLAVAGPRDAADPVALHEHVAGERRLAAAVEDAHVGEEDVGHGGLLRQR